jgi:tryptophan-rich sensory protein
MIQLALNALWSYLLFWFAQSYVSRNRNYSIVVDDFETYSQFYKINKIAGYLLLPYLAWVSFAMVLNISIWWLNK